VVIGASGAGNNPRSGRLKTSNDFRANADDCKNQRSCSLISSWDMADYTSGLCTLTNSEQAWGQPPTRCLYHNLACWPCIPKDRRKARQQANQMCWRCRWAEARLAPSKPARPLELSRTHDGILLLWSKNLRGLRQLLDLQTYRNHRRELTCVRLNVSKSLSACGACSKSASRSMLQAYGRAGRSARRSIHLSPHLRTGCVVYCAAE
jgi:hypothetical protein